MHLLHPCYKYHGLTALASWSLLDTRNLKLSRPVNQVCRVLTRCPGIRTHLVQHLLLCQAHHEGTVTHTFMHVTVPPQGLLDSSGQGLLGWLKFFSFFSKMAQ